MFVDTGKDITPEMKQLLKDSASDNPAVAYPALYAVKSALSLPIQSGTIFGDTVSGVFKMEAFDWGVPVEYPLDAVSPGEVKLHVAYTVPHEGYIPQRTIEADYVTLKLYRVATSCDWSRFMAKSMRWDVVGRAYAVAEAGMVRKRNNDGWHTIITAAADRGISISDTTISAGLFGKRVVSLAQVVMRRNAGGNSTSVDRGRLSTIAISPESLQDVRSWDVTQIDEITRREIFLAGEGYAITKIFGVELVDLDELGVGQEYQLYYNNTLGATTPNSKDEIAIGLDLNLALKNSHVMPWLRQDNGGSIQMHDDPSFLRHNRQGFWMDMYMGAGILDNRSVMIIGI
jgi:hypothetical protein